MVVTTRQGLETETACGVVPRLIRRQRAGDRGLARSTVGELLRRLVVGEPDPSRRHRRRGDGGTLRSPGGLLQPPPAGEDDVLLIRTDLAPETFYRACWRVRTASAR